MLSKSIMTVYVDAGSCRKNSFKIIENRFPEAYNLREE